MNDAWMEAMRNAGYKSQIELARAVQVSHKALSAWVRGIRQPADFEIAKRIADLLHVDVQVLFPDYVSQRLRRFRHTPFGKALIKCGYRSISEFADAAHAEYHDVAQWALGENYPRNDEAAYFIAGLLDAAPTDIFPGWKPCESHLERKIYGAGYDTIAHFAQAVCIPASRIYNWINDGDCPLNDKDALCVAKMLDSDPTELWPGWKPHKKATEQKDEGPNEAKYNPRIKQDLNDGHNRHGMDDMRHNANVCVGKRFVMHYPTKEGAVNRPGTVVECNPYWFRVQYDAGWCECFHYQCRIDQTEAKHFRKPTQNA